jgi:hypothetical protein
MSSKKHKHNQSRYVTDKSTDKLFGYYINEDKFNEQLRADFDDLTKKNIEDRPGHKLSTRITDSEYKKNIGHKSDHHKKSYSPSSSSEDTELPSNSTSKKKSDVDFNDSGSSSGSTSTSETETTVKSPYKQRIDVKSELKPKTESKKDIMGEKPSLGSKPILGDKLVSNVKKYSETPEEKRARAREAYSKLQDLVERYHVSLSKYYSIDDDPDEMEAEYAMHKARRDKTNQVKFYRNMLLNIVCGIEFLNEKYDPFAFKLKDWSKQMAADQDDYTEVLEELYEKYKDKGGKMPPEIRLLFMIIMSGVTFHLSQTLFGPSGMKGAIESNPNVLNILLKTVMGTGKKDLHEPAEARGGNGPNGANATRPNNQAILDLINKRKAQSDNSNPNLNLNPTTEAPNAQTAELEKEKNELNAQKKAFEQARKDMEAQTKRQEDIFKIRVEQARQQQEQLVRQNQHLQQVISQQGQQNQPNRPNQTAPVNYGPSSVPSSLNLNAGANLFEDQNILSSPKSARAKTSSKKPKSQVQNLSDLLESLDESSELDITDILGSSKKPAKKVGSPASSRNSTKKRRTDSASEGLSTISRRTKSNVVRL